MKKLIHTALVTNVSLIDNQHIFSISITSATLNDWCLCLQLLYDNLVETCVLLDATNRQKLELRRAAESSYSSYNDTDCSTLALSHNSLDQLRNFLLQYFRDGFAAVDHLDFDDGRNSGGYITFHVDQFAAPLSADEVRRRLGH